MENLDIFETHQQIKTKKVSATELVQTTLAKAKNSKSNALISLTADLALLKAQETDQKLSQNKESFNYLTGIPYTLKDLFITKGIRTTAGSKILFNYIPPYDGYVSAALKKAGAILVGKVSCDEFGMGSTNENTPFGAVLNPLNHDYVAGGSSGGSAAAVAEGVGHFSMGTDTGGSVRLPANFCGLVGLKPTYGRVSRYGQIAYASSLDQASPMARTVLDMGCIMESITEKDPHDMTNAPLGPMKIVDRLLNLPTQYLKGKKLGVSEKFISACAPDVQKALHSALEVFKKAGVEVVPVELSHLKYAVSTYYIIATSEASANLARYDGIHYGFREQHKGDLEDTYKMSRTEGLGKEVKKRIILGTFSLSSGYYDAYFTRACKIRRLIAQDFAQALQKCDALFSPVCATTAFKAGECLKDSLQMYMNDLYTIPVNLAGLPGLAIPYGQGSTGLPTGFQLIGGAFKDEELLELGHAFERAVKG